MRSVSGSMVCDWTALFIPFVGVCGAVRCGEVRAGSGCWAMECTCDGMWRCSEWRMVRRGGEWEWEWAQGAGQWLVWGEERGVWTVQSVGVYL